MTASYPKKCFLTIFLRGFIGHPSNLLSFSPMRKLNFNQSLTMTSLVYTHQRLLDKFLKGLNNIISKWRWWNLENLLLHQFWILIDMFYPNVGGSCPHAHALSCTALCRPMRWLVSLSKLSTVQPRPYPYWECMVAPAPLGWLPMSRPLPYAFHIIICDGKLSPSCTTKLLIESR